MTALSWNCQGLGLPWKIQFLKNDVQQHEPSFVFLCETLCGKVRMEKIQRELNYEGMVVVEAQGKSGGMALLWKQENQATLLSFSNYHIDIETKSFGVGSWRFMGFHGEPNRSNRRKTWDLLRNLSRDSNLPWCVMGDLNNIVSQSDKRGGVPYPTWLVEGFNETLVDSGLVDMHIMGHQFTWERSRGTTNWIETRLDRVLTNERWNNLFSRSKLYNLEGSPSDHNPIYLDTRSNFATAWHLGGREVTGNFSGRIKKCKAELTNLRNKTDQLWLQAGDKNTRYFHVAASERRRSNAIQKLQNTEGEWFEWNSGLGELIANYFERLFSATEANWEEVVDKVLTTITAAHNEYLTREISVEEVKFALFQMHPDKAPGPDGMTPGFFRNTGL
ncbi:uncharacterized protein LOC141703019 [Apium graveolens]|uniref:uncharacterized protein LOC141703019 n=1 Tax=Apium graveolens TaxID=4045 RepID=UPI003D794598